MKVNVKFLMPFAILLLGVFACEKEEQSTDDAAIAAIVTADNLAIISAENLPDVSKNYIDENYFDTYVEEAAHAVNKGYRTILGNGETLYFRTNGDVMEYEGEVMEHGPFGGVNPHGPCHRPRPHHGDRPHPHRPFAFAIGDLPAAIVDYVAENYPDNEIVRAALRDDKFIILVNAPALLAFDAEGNFIEELNPLRHCRRPCQALGMNELPAAVAAYITENFPDAIFRRACNTQRGTVVFLTNGDQRVFLGFNADGELVFQRP